MLIYEPYHVHTYFSNPLTQPDSCVSVADYAKEFSARGHQTLCLTEHGNRSNAWQQFEAGKKFGLKPIVGAECYFVPNRDPALKDNRNFHLILLAKDMEGFRELNYILSQANENGYYYKARVDFELLESLHADHFLCTTACVAGPVKDENAVEYCSRLKTIFRDNFFLEVQHHPQQIQIEHNKKILDLYRKLDIPLIYATDTHYINTPDANLRKELLLSAGIGTVYEDEFDMNLPTAEQAFELMKAQGVLSKAQIEEAFDNTLRLRDFEGVHFTPEKKIPNAFPHLSLEQRNDLYRQQVLDGYTKKTGVPNEIEMAELEKEMDAVTDTGTADYFLIMKRVVDKAIENGGVLTNTGRGSGVSFATNYALGFTSINRLKCPVRLFPDRFISKERLASGSLPDLDLNISNLEAFEEAGKNILGQYGCLPMVAFGTNKTLSAFKLLARARELDFDLSNKVSKQLAIYEKERRHALENNSDNPDYDVDDDISVTQFIDEEYIPLIEESKKYQGIVMNLSPHPCAHLLLDKDIRKEIGVIRCKSKNGSKEPVMAAYIDGATADAYGYLKADFLRVDVVKTIDAAFKEAKVPMFSVDELLKKVEFDTDVWNLYSRGCTIGLNQVEQDKTTKRVMEYKPKNVVELAAFVAAVRPGFKSMLSTYIQRRPFEYGIPSLDVLLKTKEIPDSFLMYDEQILTVLQAAGIPASDAYVCTKAIKKKKADKVMAFKDRFRDGYVKALIEKEGATVMEADEVVDKIWTIIENAASYMFCAAHAFSMACDSLYAAWLKAHYPYEFYITMLKIFTEKGNKEKIAAIINEMREFWGIHLQVGSFGIDNSDWAYNKETKTIFQSLSAMKFISKYCAKTLAQLGKRPFADIVDLFREIFFNTSINARQVKVLIMTNYFSMFGKPGKILRIWNEFTSGKNKISKSLIPSSVEKRIQILKDFASNCENEDLPIYDKLVAEYEAIGLCMAVCPDLPRAAFFCTEVETDYSNRIHLYSIKTGRLGEVRISKALFASKPIEPGDIVYIRKYYTNAKTNIIWLQVYEVEKQTQLSE